MEIGRTLARITRRRHMHWTFVGLSHAGLPLAGGDAGAPADDQRGRKIEFLRRRQTWSDPSGRRNSTFTTTLRFHTSVFRRGRHIEFLKKAANADGVGRTPPRLEIQICRTNPRSPIFDPTPNNTHDLSPPPADDDSHPAAVVCGARGSGARCRQREALGRCRISRISIQSVAGPAVPASPFV